MKSAISFAVIAMMAGSAFAAAPSHISRDGRGGYDVTYSYKDKPKSGWYAAARAEVNLLNWEYKYSAGNTTTGEAIPSAKDDHSFEPVFGGALAFGKRINYFWRAEIEGGFIGYYSSDNLGGSEKLSLPYAMINGYYDFTNGLYLGAGVGAALPISTRSTMVDGIVFQEDTKTSVSPMAGLMLGFSHKLDDNLVLDLRYRLAGIMGFEQKMNGYDNTDEFWFKTKTDFMLDNSISVGLRYEF